MAGAILVAIQESSFMRQLCALLLLMFGSFLVVGCSESKPDPSTQPGFVDMSDPDPSKISLPQTPTLPSQPGAEGAAPAPGGGASGAGS